MNFLKQIFGGDESSTSNSATSQRPTAASNTPGYNDGTPFTFQYIEPGRIAYLRIGTLKDAAPACTPQELERGLCELTEYLDKLSDQSGKKERQLSCIVSNFTPFDPAMMTPFGMVMPPIDEGEGIPFDRVDKIVQFCASVAHYTHKRNDRVVLLVFADETPSEPEVVDYSLLAVTSLLMYEGKLDFRDANDALEAVTEMFGLQPSTRHSATHRAVLKRFRTMFQLPQFPGAASTMLLSQVTIHMPKNVGPVIRGLRFVLRCRGEIVFRTDSEWVQGETPRDIVLDLTRCSISNGKNSSSSNSNNGNNNPVSLYGDCELCLFRIDQGDAPQLLLRATISTLFVSGNAITSTHNKVKIPSSDIDLQPRFRGAGPPSFVFAPESLVLTVAAGRSDATKQQLQHSKEILRDAEFSALGQKFGEVAEMAPEVANEIIASAAASPARNRAGSIFSNNASITSGSGGGLSFTAAAAASSSGQHHTPSAALRAANEALADAVAVGGGIATPFSPGGPTTSSSATTAGIKHQQQLDKQYQENASQLVYVFLRRETENGGALGRALNEFASTIAGGPSSSRHIRCHSTTLARPAALAYLSNKNFGPTSSTAATDLRRVAADQFGFRSPTGVGGGVFVPTSSSTAANSSSAGGTSLFTSPAGAASTATINSKQLALFKVVPKNQWKSSTGRCMFQDCGVAYGLFSRSGNCHVCGINCCSSCLSETVTLPGESDPVPVCPRCLNRWTKLASAVPSAASHQQQQHRYGTPPPATAATTGAGASTASGHGTPDAAHRRGVSPMPPTAATRTAAATAQQSQHHQQSQQPGAPLPPPEMPKVVIKVQRKEKWQDPDKVSKCQNQDGCGNTFGFWRGHGTSCHCCGLRFCSSCIVANTDLPPTYPTPVPVCGRCFSAAEIIKREATTIAAKRSVAAKETLHRLNYKDTSREASPQGAGAGGVVSSASASFNPRTAAATANTTSAQSGQPLQRSQSGGASWIEFGKRQQQQQQQQMNQPEQQASATAATGTATMPKVQIVRAKSAMLHGTASTFAHPSAGDDSDQQRQRHSNALSDIPFVNEQEKQQQQEEDNINDNSDAANVAPTPRVLDSTMKQQQQPQPQQGDQQEPQQPKHVDPVPAVVVIEPPKQQQQQQPAAETTSPAVKPKPKVSPFGGGGGGGMGALMAELAARRGGAGGGDASVTAAATTPAVVVADNNTKQPAAIVAEVVEPQPPKPTSSDAKDAVDPNAPRGKTNGTFRPPLNSSKAIPGNMPPIPGEQQRLLQQQQQQQEAEEERQRLQQEQEHQNSNKKTRKRHDWDDNAVVFGNTNGAFKPRLNSKAAVRGKMPPIPGHQQPDEENDDAVEAVEATAGVHIWDDNNTYYGKTNGTFKPPLNSSKAIRGKMPPIPGQPAQSEEERRQQQQTWDDNVTYYGKTNGAFKPPLNNSKAVRGKMPPIPGSAASDSDDQSQQQQQQQKSSPSSPVSTKAPASSAPPMSAAAAMMAALAAKKNAPMSPTSPNSPSGGKKMPAVATVATQPEVPKMKTLFWKKLTAERFRKSGLWNSATADDLSGVKVPKPREDMIRPLFEIKKKEVAATAPSADGTKKKGKKSQAVTGQRQQNVGIALKKFRVTPEELCNAILECDSTFFTDEVLDAVIKILPQDDEIRNLKHEKSQGADLYEHGEVEEFFYMLSVRVPDAKERLTLWKTAMEIPRNIELAEQQLMALDSAAEAVTARDSPLVCVLRCIRDIGNVVNKGSALANAGGFTLESLATLAGTKGTDNKTTLLDLVFDLFAKEFGVVDVEDRLAFEDELCNKLVSAINSPIAATATLVSALANAVQRLKRMMAAAATNNTNNIQGGGGDKLVQLMSDCHTRYSGAAADLLLRLQTTKDSIANALEFLGEDRAGDDAVVFQLLLNFLRELSKARQLWLRKHQLALKKQKHEQEQAAKQAIKQQQQQQERERESPVVSSSASAPSSPTTTATTSTAMMSTAASTNEYEDARAGLRRTPLKAPAADAPNSTTSQQAPAEPGWETTPSSLFSRVPPPRRIALDDDDEDWDQN